MRFLKTFTLITLIAACVSCASEDEITSTTDSVFPEAAKTVEMTNFRNSLIQMMKFKHSDISKTASDPNKIEEASQEIILADAKKLLIANGISISEFNSKSKEDNSKIISLALKLYAEKTKTTIIN
jgi:hypothetical protein